MGNIVRADKLHLPAAEAAIRNDMILTEISAVYFQHISPGVSVNAINLDQLFRSPAYSKAIKHIRFPSYRNLQKGLHIDFGYPITAIVGANGTNKTSVLRALEACPKGYDLGNWWFSTSLDPINQATRPRYIYGFKEPHSRNTVEVRKVRIERKDRGRDYWETSKPADGMKPMEKVPPGKAMQGRDATRWNPIDMDVVYLDFRGELPAYEKYMQHPNVKEFNRDLDARKEWVRTRTRQLTKAFMGFDEPYYGKNRVRQLVTLPRKELTVISEILGRTYDSIEMVFHDYFDRPGWTVRMKVGDRKYSEAYAGSGEFAVVVMVHRILNAASGSLILMDEPETSLHPASQKGLMKFLLELCKTKHHQIIFATHSTHMIESLPDHAIKLLQLNEDGKVELNSQSSSSSEAFFRLGAPKTGKLHIFVEDLLAKGILEKAIEPLGESYCSRVFVEPYPGGAEAIITRLVPSLAQSGNDALIVLDGDKSPVTDNAVSRGMLVPEDIAEKDASNITSHDLEASMGRCFRSGAIPIVTDDGGDDRERDLKKAQRRQKVLLWIYASVRFFPGASPEEYLCQKSGQDELDGDKAKGFFAEKAASELNLPVWRRREISAKDILASQMRFLAPMNFDEPEWAEMRDEIVRRLDRS